MSVDLSQFHQVFFEESFEGLDIMESGLLELNIGTADEELINTIFRAAHSIKGGSGTFGFSAIADFTHVMETLLDEMRDGRRTVTQENVDLLLQSVDCLREMLHATRDGDDVDQFRVAGVQEDLESLLQGKTEDGGMAENCSISQQQNGEMSSEAEQQDSKKKWEIQFSPFSGMLKTGNDPLRMFRELAELGDLSVQADTGKLPALSALDPHDCYLSWTLTLEGEIERTQIVEVFEWVEEDCELEIKNLSASIPVAKPSKPAEPVRSGKDRRSGDDRRKQEIKFEGEDRRSNVERRVTKDRRNSESTSIRVDIDKVDALINKVGELVITQSMLSQFSENTSIQDLEKLRAGLNQLERNTREIQEGVMRIRMLPINFSFSRFPRLVRDLSNKLNKKIELTLSGEQTELDKTVMEKISDPLVHLVRNSLDHGIESPAERVAAGKPETGSLHLNAAHEGGNIVIEISDDGAGLNEEKILQRAIERGLVSEGEEISEEKIHQLVFQAGFSTAEEVSDVSGRGVGMDVVRRNISDLGGSVEVKSVAGKGSTFSIRLPLTLAILDGQLVCVGQHVYIIPLVSIVESLQVEVIKVNSIAGKTEVYQLRDEYIPILRLHDVFNIEPDSTKLAEGLLVVVESDERKVGIFVDDLLAQQQIVIKSLETNYEKVEGISGATILGDGKVALILDIDGLISLANNSGTGKLKLVDVNTMNGEAA
jgi:two-component system, chemotaxis family, sensor kinase CheA